MTLFVDATVKRSQTRTGQQGKNLYFSDIHSVLCSPYWYSRRGETMDSVPKHLVRYNLRYSVAIIRK